MIVTAGRNGWIGDVKYHAVTFSIEGTFTTFETGSTRVLDRRLSHLSAVTG